MSLDSDTKFLSSVSFFSGFVPEALRLLAFGSSRCSLVSGSVLYGSGDVSDGGYVVVRGLVELSGAGDDRSCKIGSLIGELSLISEMVHSGEARVIEDCELILIPRPLFLRVLEEYPETAQLLLNRIGDSSREFIQMLELISARLDHASATYSA